MKNVMFFFVFLSFVRVNIFFSVTLTFFSQYNRTSCLQLLTVQFVCQDGAHSGGVNCVQWHPEESLLYSGSDDTNIVEWDLQTGKTRRSVTTFSLG